MYDSQATGTLRMRWSSVIDEHGEEHLEARWVVSSEATATSVAMPEASLSASTSISQAA